MDYAIVNAGMLLKVDDKKGTVDTLRFCAGNIESKPCSLQKVSNLAKGRFVQRKFSIKVVLLIHVNDVCFEFLLTSMYIIEV